MLLRAAPCAGCVRFMSERSSPAWLVRGLMPLELDHLLGGDAAWALGYDHTPRGGRYERFRKQLREREGAFSCAGAKSGSASTSAATASTSGSGSGKGAAETVCTSGAAVAAMPPPTQPPARGVPDKDGAPQILWLDAPVWVEDLSAAQAARVEQWRSPGAE